VMSFELETQILLGEFIHLNGGEDLHAPWYRSCTRKNASR
jgi:hypothetical protein